MSKKSSSEILEEYIKNFELKHKLKIKKSKKSELKAIKYEPLNSNPISKIEKVVDTLSTRIKEYKEEMCLLNIKNAKVNLELKKSQTNIEEDLYDPYEKSLEKLQELNKKLFPNGNLISAIEAPKELIVKDIQKPKLETSECVENFIKECMKITDEIPFLKKPTETDLFKI